MAEWTSWPNIRLVRRNLTVLVVYPRITYERFFWSCNREFKYFFFWTNFRNCSQYCSPLSSLANINSSSFLKNIPLNKVVQDTAIPPYSILVWVINLITIRTCIYHIFKFLFGNHKIVPRLLAVFNCHKYEILARSPFSPRGVDVACAQFTAFQSLL